MAGRLRHTRRLRVVRAGGAAATSAWLMGAVVLALSATRVAVCEGRRGRHGSLSVLDVEALAATASAPWFDEDPPRGACSLGDDALAVVLRAGRVWVVNPGSVAVGRSRDSHSCALLDLRRREVVFYDLATGDAFPVRETSLSAKE